ncbi:hypothetical protein CC78DRAFT_605740 [Lojkania enalia]|uniref:Uncharacterized protein n=1 Tax=Lojkania enalia TaxID=147567 RepID=A0A9P4N7Q8_9PLEO|nr:hypothetical protein CC78DRAFT_605740 [Didymosphaeria enalia]
MAPSPTHNQSEPLLPSKLANEQFSSLSTTSTTAIKALSILRIAVGASCIIAPRWSCALFQFPIPAAYSVMPRIFGVRDLILGELLITAENKESPDGGRREIKRALWANIGADVVDVGSVLFGLATGTVGRAPAAIFGGGAAAFVILGVLGLRGL